jgi:hypothetical protein
MAKDCAIMQPYFLPYLGYWQLMKSVEEWVIFDDIQYIKKGWVNRNKITNIHNSQESLYLMIPTIGRRRDTLIREVRISNSYNWGRIILARFNSLRKHCDYFDEGEEILNQVIAFKTDWLVDFLINSIEIIHKALEIDTGLRIQSLHCAPIDAREINDSGEWALKISSFIHAKNYINPIGGEALFSKQKFKNAGINLSFLTPTLPNDYLGNVKTGWDKSIIEPISRYGLAEVKKQLSNGIIEVSK